MVRPPLFKAWSPASGKPWPDAGFWVLFPFDATLEEIVRNPRSIDRSGARHLPIWVATSHPVTMLVPMRNKCVRAIDVDAGTPITGGGIVHAIAIEPFVVFLELHRGQSLLQPPRQLGRRGAFAAIHPRVTTVTAVDLLL